MKKAIFLDRDGTLIEERDYLHRPDQVAIFPGAGAALRKAIDAGYTLVMITNQSGVGRGYFTLDDVRKVHERLSEDLARDGVEIEKTYIAPEAPDQPSRGRKPSPQFLFDARDELGIDLGASYMVGDKLIDLECGWNAGVKKCFLVRTGYGAKLEKSEPEKLKAAGVADTLADAVEQMIKG